MKIDDTILDVFHKLRSIGNDAEMCLRLVFCCELVAQDPNEEPADELLKRIATTRAEAEALAKAAKKVGKKITKRLLTTHLKTLILKRIDNVIDDKKCVHLSGSFLRVSHVSLDASGLVLADGVVHACSGTLCFGDSLRREVRLK